MMKRHKRSLLFFDTVSWTAMVQFAGVGKTSAGFDTTDWLAKLATTFKMDNSLRSLMSEVRAAGEKYVGNLEPHSFTISGFEGDRPFVSVISNFQGLPDTREFFSRRQWIVSTSRQRHIAIATGSGATCLVPADLRNLANIARRCPPNVVLQTLAKMNRHVAADRASRNTVSDSCFAAHLRYDGAGEELVVKIKRMSLRLLKRMSPRPLSNVSKARRARRRVRSVRSDPLVPYDVNPGS